MRMVMEPPAVIPSSAILSSGCAGAGAAARPGRRITIATINRREGQTGVHTHTRALARGLASSSAACEVISAFDAGLGWLGVFAIRPLLLHPINRSWSTLWHRKWHHQALYGELSRRWSRQHPDAVIAQCPVSADAAMRARAGASFPILMVCHFNISEAEEYRAKGELSGEDRFERMMEFENRVLREVDGVIYVSNWAQQRLEQTRGIAPRSSSVIWNGIEEAPAAHIGRAELGLSAADLVWINVGTLEPRKNQLALLDIFAAARVEFPSAKLLLVGEGPDRARIERRISELSLKNAVRLLGHRRDVAQILPLADLYVHAAAMENCPISLIEAARAGLPIAAFPAGGVAELQEALNCQFEIDPDDVEGSMASLRRLLRDAAARKAAGAAARIAYQQRFSLEAMTRAYQSVVEAHMHGAAGSVKA